MKVLLIDRNKITKYDLPEKIEDSFVINYKPIGGKESVITLESQDGKWILKSNGSVNIINSSMIATEVELVNYGGYLLKFLGIDNFVSLYAMPTIEHEKYKLDFSGLDRIIIGNSENCHICYRNNSISPLHAEIKKMNGEWYIAGCADTNFRTFLNNKLITSPQKLKVGDVVFINGFKLIWMRSFLQINNPAKQITVAGLKAYNQLGDISNSNYVPPTDEEQSVELYSEDDYFYHIPRIKEIVEEEEVEIDPPPGSQEQEETPFLLTLGSSITMAASSLMMGYNVGYGLISGTRTILSALPQIVMCIAMIIGSLIMPRIVTAYQKKKAKEREALRLRKYGEYLDKKEKQIDLLQKKQAQILRDNSIAVTNCTNIVMSNGNRNFWSREINDDDFLKIRLGIGSIPSLIKISAPREQFTLDEDDLLNRVHEIKDKYKKMHEVPVNLSLIEKNVAALICSNSFREKFIDSVILQLVTLHSAADLKIVILTNEENSNRWEYAKFLPHCLSEDKTVRFFATNAEELKEVSNFLEEEFKTRRSLIESNGGKKDNPDAEEINKADEYKNFQPYYLIINDDFKSNHGIPIIDNILKYSEKNYGFSFLVFTNSMKKLPTKVESFVEIGEKDGCILEKNISVTNQQRFIVEYDPNVNMREISNKLLNIPLMTKEGLSILPTSLSFLEMYGVSKIEHLNILNRWKTNNPVTSLAVPIGVHASGEQFKLNLHEKFHGPHGLIAGSTGSGKSEFIITYILSMCVNYHPYEVQFVLIDYKGGGLAGAFENKETGVRIPHLAGTITNLDTAEMNRTLVSIESEMKRRQRIFNDTRDALGESTIDIYKYQRLYREGQVKEPMAHLFIISDEFAELKSQQPEFMSQLISTARIGRSLGVHLILATQKPSGVVNDQIWSNSKFKVCLKVQDRSDSMEMLKRPEAASIKETGRFYLQVGYDDFFDKGQSGWAGAKYVPTDRIVKKVDDAIEYINNVGYGIKTIKDMVKVEDKTDYGDQLTNIVKQIHNLSIREDVKTNRLWLDSIPKNILIESIREKYSYKPHPYQISPLIGEYDKPMAQEQNYLSLDLSNNSLIWGQAGAGKENLLTTIIWSSSIEHTPEEVNFYIIDCGSESLKMFNKFPHVGDIATLDEQAKIVDMFIMVEEELIQRKDLMADYGGNYKEYNEHSGQKKPLMVVIINNYEVFSETYAKLSESIQTFFRDGSKYGIVFVVSAISSNGVRGRTINYFNNKLCLQIPNETEYRNLVNAPKGLTPMKTFGRGLIAMDGTAYEFQTANICERKELTNTVREAAEKFNQAYTVKAKKVPTVPEIIHFVDMKNEIEEFKMPLGIEMDSKVVSTYNFFDKKITSIISEQLDPIKYSFYDALIKEFSMIPELEVNVIDLISCLKNTENINYYNNSFDNAIIELNNRIMRNKGDDGKKIINIFIGIGMIKEKLSPNARAVLNNIFVNTSTIPNSYYIIADAYQNYKNLQVEPWYQGNVDNSSGIWIGEGIGNQLALNISNLSMEDRKLAFPFMAYVINRGQHVAIKHIVDDSLEG